MSSDFTLIKPRFVPPLDEGFRPAVLANHAFIKEVEASGAGVPLVLGLERADGSVSRYESRVFPEGHARANANLMYVERIVKFLLWQRGGWKVHIGGPKSIGAYVAKCYSPNGERAFDYQFMGQDVYERTFTVVSCNPEDVPAEKETTRPLGRHLDGYRIGFDLGASDRKVSAVVNGEAIFSEEVVWEPRKHSDPTYHYNEILAALKSAASKMPP